MALSMSHCRQAEVHIVEGGGAAGQHLAASLQGTFVDKFVGELLLGWPDIVVEPDIQRLVVA